MTSTIDLKKLSVTGQKRSVEDHEIIRHCLTLNKLANCNIAQDKMEIHLENDGLNLSDLKQINMLVEG